MIIDTHVHFYDPFRPEGVPWPAPEDKIYRRVLPEDFKQIALPEGVSGVIVVEASEWVEDNQWILDMAAEEPFIVGFVGNLMPGQEGFRAYLERFSRDPAFRGMRIGAQGMPDLKSRAVLADIAVLPEMDLSLDLLIGPDDLSEAAGLAERFPELRIIINHVGRVRIDGKTPDPAWRYAMCKAGEHPNVYCKFSGLTELAHAEPAPEGPAFYAPVLDILWQSFGEDRLLYASNWPVSEPSAEYSVVRRLATRCFAGKGEDACERLFWKNSRTAYKWQDRDAVS